LAIGLLSGLFQWVILRPQVERSGWWVWATAGGIALAILVAAVILGLVSAVGWLRPEDFPSAQSWGVAGATVGLVYGAMSGLSVIRALHLPSPR
jgi:flagellar motor component MotA